MLRGRKSVVQLQTEKTETDKGPQKWLCYALLMIKLGSSSAMLIHVEVALFLAELTTELRRNISIRYNLDQGEGGRGVPSTES